MDADNSADADIDTDVIDTKVDDFNDGETIVTSVSIPYNELNHLYLYESIQYDSLGNVNQINNENLLIYFDTSFGNYNQVILIRMILLCNANLYTVNDFNDISHKGFTLVLYETMKEIGFYRNL
ncbi:hypothetical protein PIROE2DRAFT_14894 [Piromyces sp. E2]|nr:hypothetical protein PIROE2DRAFT_14894 [Piromyces sp. E2]|eukprot:OUM59535.1 hypothetical protein PIROE2DRAFT_14894 [Piromyces sp. E2]